MDETPQRSGSTALERRARRDARWSAIDASAEWVLNLLACAMVGLLLSTSLLFAAPAARERPQSDHRAKAIVNGHQMQPKPSDLRTPDISTRDAEDVDRLYRELMELTAPDAVRGSDRALEPEGLASRP